MKKLIRPIAGILTALFVVSCASPYQAQMQAVQNAYASGNMSESEYRQRMNDLYIADAGWQQQNANNATTAAAVGVAALGVAAIANNNDHHHHHYNNGYWHNGHWHPRRR